MVWPCHEKIGKYCIGKRAMGTDMQGKKMG